MANFTRRQVTPNLGYAPLVKTTVPAPAKPKAAPALPNPVTPPPIVEADEPDKPQPLPTPKPRPKPNDKDASLERRQLTRLAMLAHDRDLSHRAIALRCGMHYPMVSRILAGKSPNVGLQSVNRILAAIGATLADLVDD